jgi:hypothetical protein
MYPGGEWRTIGAMLRFLDATRTHGGAADMVVRNHLGLDRVSIGLDAVVFRSSMDRVCAAEVVP